MVNGRVGFTVNHLAKFFAHFVKTASPKPSITKLLATERRCDTTIMITGKASAPTQMAVEWLPLEDTRGGCYDAEGTPAGIVARVKTSATR